MDFDPQKRVLDNFSFIVNTFGVPSTIIEIGTFEGLTSLWMSDNLTPHNKNLKIYTIDPHVGSDDMSDDFNIVKTNFEHNISVCVNKNINHINKFSSKGLVDLINTDVSAELIYIDGDHKASTVLSDLVMSWKLLKVGGVIVCDDATNWKWRNADGSCSVEMSPRMAIETFIQCNWNKLDVIVLPHGIQTAFIKLEE